MIRSRTAASVALSRGALALLLSVGASCAAEGELDPAEQQADEFRVAWNPSTCIMARARQPRLRICVRGTGNIANAREMTRRSLEAWLVPLRQRYEGIATGIEFSCDRPDGTVNVYTGDGRAHAAPGVVLGIYDSRPIGSWIHEFGHAFACLGDTYVGGTAARCQPGQPRSIMCFGLLLDHITDDDVAGVVSQAERLRFPRLGTTPDASVPAPDASMPPSEPPPEPPPPPPPADRCAAATSCGACAPLVGCGWCGADSRCVSVDRNGLPTGACGGGFAPTSVDCPNASGVTSCGRFASWSVWTCTDSRTRVRCRGGSLEREVCSGRCAVYPTGVDDRCE